MTNLRAERWLKPMGSKGTVAAADERANEAPRSFRSASGLRKSLVCVIVLVKVAYILWFYAFGIGLNLGDTASYIDESSVDVYFERSGGIGFAYVATVLYSNPVTRVLIEALTVWVMCKLLVQLRTDVQAIAATCLLLLPSSLAFMTVASKELLVFLLLCVVYRMRLLVGLPALVVTAALKPSFVAIAILPLIRRISFVPLYLLFASAVAVVLVPLERWADLYRSFFAENYSHFTSGNLTYGDSGLFPIAPFLRVVGLDFAGLGSNGWAVGLMVLAVNLFVFFVLVTRYGPFKGAVMYLVFVVAVMPYSIHNLGSAARYQAPLACALVLNELLVRARIQRVLTGKSAA